jgi:tetratricopeptide (TPR) repeat protein
MSVPTAHVLWNIPYQRNLFFTGREDVLSRLHSALQAENSVAISQPQGITGLGGIGKTQTVVEYAYRYSNEYDAIFWVRADSLTALTSSMIELARVLELPERHEEDQEIIVQAVLRWFRLHTNWLLIYDSIGDLTLAERFLPKAGPGHLLFTTRVHAFGGLAQRLDIQKMEPEIGALLLLRRASLLALQATLSIANPNDQSIAQVISQELDGLPLALDQAGAYIKEAPCSLQDYLSRYQSRRSDILRVRGQFDQDYPASVATTWSLSFEKVRQSNTAAADLLNFCAFLAPDAIPETMISQGAAHLPSHLQEVVVHPLRFDRTIAALLAYSLLHRNTNETLNVHRLVQAVLQDGMDEPSKKQWAERVVHALHAAFPSVEHQYWSQCDRLLPHAKLGADLINAYGIVFWDAARLLNRTGLYLSKRARYQEAEPLYQQALSIDKQVYGPDHPEVATIFNNLAELYRNQGKYAQAEPLYQRALAISEQQLGAEHPATALSLNNLALLYENQGKYAQAEPLYQRALAIKEQQLGPEHPDTATSLNNLAELYRDQGKYAQAKPLLERALAISEQQLGAEHPDTAMSLNNLALLYKSQGKYAQAEPLYQRALAISEQQLGPEHPDTTTSLNNLAMLYQDRGKYAEAEPLLERALAIKEQQLEAEHPDIANSLNNLAMLYENQGKYAQAEPLLERALAIKEQRLEAEHPATALSLNNLAMLYFRQGKYAQAEPLYQRALAISEQQLEAEHPATALSLNNLALLYFSQGKCAEAEPLYQRALHIWEQSLGPDHPEVATVLNNLAALYDGQEKYAEAEPLYVRVLAIREAKYLDTVLSLNNLASLYKKQGKYAEAEPLYVRVLAIREQQMGTKHLDTVLSLNNLALLYHAQGKYAEAGPLYIQALTICEQLLGPKHSTTKTIRQNYGLLILQTMKRKVWRKILGILKR